jgi:hypothetical protein
MVLLPITNSSRQLNWTGWSLCAKLAFQAVNCSGQPIGPETSVNQHALRNIPNARWAQLHRGGSQKYRTVHRFSSRNSPHFMGPESSLPHSQVPATCPCPKPAPLFHCLVPIKSINPSPRLCLWIFCNKDMFSRWVVSTNPCQLSATTYSIYSLLHLQCKDAPCRGDRDQLITWRVAVVELHT